MNYQYRGWLLTLFLCLPNLGFAGEAAGKTQFMGVKVCAKCHYDHGEAWADTVHARAFDSLKAGVNAEAKRKAGLDPNTDYTRSDNCLACHTTGFGTPGGYEIGMPIGKNSLASVSCESCHGAGELFRDEHGKAESQYKKDGKKSARSLLIKTGQNFNYEQACIRCHANYEGKAGATPPFSPFTPKVDAKYLFDYPKALHATGKSKAIHTHYKLLGIFEGDPIPAERVEFQKTASEPASD